MDKWAHDALLEDLADHLARPERMMWLDMQMGPSGSPRPDIFTMAKSYTNPKPIAYEIKVSVSDFRRDITSGKWQTYLGFSQGVTFCVPQGLVTKADLPAGCGLMVRGPESWRTLKAPTLNKTDLPPKVMLKLLIDGLNREYHLARGQQRERIPTYIETRKRFGDRVASVLNDTGAAERRLANLREKEASLVEQVEAQRKKMIDKARNDAARITEESASIKAGLLEALGLPPDTSMMLLRREVLKIHRRLDRDPLIAEIRHGMTRARDQLNSLVDICQGDPPE